MLSLAVHPLPFLVSRCTAFALLPLNLRFRRITLLMMVKYPMFFFSGRAVMRAIEVPVYKRALI